MTLRVLSLLIWLVATPAMADPGRDLLKEGVRHYTYAEYGQAVQALSRASRRARDPKLLARVFLYLGLSYAVIGVDEKAERCFVTAMTHDPLIRPDPFRIKPDLVALFASTRDRQRATLRVEADQPDAVAVVDGGAPSRLPLRLKVAIGKHRVEVRTADGELREQREVLLAPAAVMQISARLGRRTPASAPVARQLDHPSRGRVWTWVALAGAVASAGVAGGLWASVQSDMTEYNDPATPDARALAMEDPIRRKVTATNAMIGVAGALAAGAVVLFFVEGRGSRPASTTAGASPLGAWTGNVVSF